MVDYKRADRKNSQQKPFLYALAVENGIAAPDTVIEDRPRRHGAYGQ